jgi:hypothetical protein
VTTGVAIAVDAFQNPPFTMRVHLVTQTDQIKKRWKGWGAAVQNGKRIPGAGPYPGGLIPGYDDARGGVQAYFGFEWRHEGADYASDATLAAQLVSWLRALVT